MLTALKLFGPLITAPLFTVHRYEEAWNTGVIEYETPDCAHCPEDGPLMEAGMFGMPLAMLLQRCALALPQLLTADTHTVDPAGITAGKRMEAEVPAGDTIAPATFVDQV